MAHLILAEKCYPLLTVQKFTLLSHIDMTFHTLNLNIQEYFGVGRLLHCVMSCVDFGCDGIVKLKV